MPSSQKATRFDVGSLRNCSFRSILSQAVADPVDDTHDDGLTQPEGEIARQG
jgi:hypothetical protein